MILAFVLVAAFSLAASWFILSKAPVGLRHMVVAWSALTGLCWALWPSAEYLLRTETAILTDQLLGHGRCQFQEPHLGRHTLNPLAALLVRNPEFYCPMWAADHLAAAARGLSATERDAALRAFDEALKKQPETYDTGDGVIRYGEHLRVARAAFRSAYQ